MTSVGTAGYLVDSDIFVYSYSGAELAKQQRALAVITRLESTDTGAISTQVLGEFLWVATRRLRPSLSLAQAERSVTNWVRSWTVFDLTPTIVLEAIRGAQRYQMQYWDALIWATAKLNGIPTLLTEDYSDGAIIEGVRYLNPFRPEFDPATL